MCQVSVIIPNYNHAKYLTQRIESVLNQTFQDFEIIILDDCSTDNSREVIEKYRHHPKVSQVVFNEENSGGAFKQWNKGLALAQGKYVWIAESDDYCEETLLSNLIAGILKDENTVLSFCQSVCMTDEGEIKYLTKATAMEEIWDGEEFVREKMMGGNKIGNASMVVFKKAAIEKIPSDYMKMRYCGDWLFWTHLCVQGKVYISGKFLNYYRQHDNNVTSTAVKQGLIFIEGNEVFHVIRKKSPSARQIENATQQRIKSYLHQRKMYESSVNESVVNSLKEIIPDIRRRFFVLRLKQSVKNFNRALRRKIKI